MFLLRWKYYIYMSSKLVEFKIIVLEDKIKTLPERDPAEVLEWGKWNLNAYLLEYFNLDPTNDFIFLEFKPLVKISN